MASKHADDAAAARPARADLFWAKIEARRAFFGLNKGDFAAMTGIAAQRLSEYTGPNSRGRPPRKFEPGWLLRLARTLGVTLEYLCDDAIPVDRPVATAAVRTLTDDERTILRKARKVGYDEAIHRLTDSRHRPGDDPTMPAISGGPRAGGGGAGARGRKGTG